MRLMAIILCLGGGLTWLLDAAIMLSGAVGVHADQPAMLCLGMATALLVAGAALMVRK